MATLTLAQHGQNEKQPLRKGMLLGLAHESLAADIMSYRGITNLQETGIRYDEVISPDWIPIDGSISSKTANGKPLAFGVNKMAVHIDIPVELEDASSDKLERDSATQSRLALKGASYVLNDTFINGDQGTDADQAEGLNKLVASLGSAQTVGAAEIDVSPDATYSDALAESLFKRIDDGIYAVSGHDPSWGIADASLLKVMESYARQYKMRGNDFDWTTAPYVIDDPRMTLRTASAKPAFMYRKIPFYDLGVKADQSTRVIGSTYTEGGATATATRLFFAKEGPEDFEGLEFKPLDIRPIHAEGHTLEDKDVYRWRLGWILGYAAWSPDCIVKVQGITVT